MSETTSSSATRVVISRSALAEAASAAVAAGGSVADLRGDAYGHGTLMTARAVTAAGARSVIVDSASAVAELAREGISAAASGTADIDPMLLYGIADGAHATGTPALRLLGRILSTKALQTGDAVSYGYSYRAPSARTVALVTGGYAQGIVRALGNHAEVEIDGRLCPIIGRVAMDVCVVDLGDADAGVGSEVIYFGGAGAAARQLRQWAAVTGMSEAELLTVAASHAVREEEA